MRSVDFCETSQSSMQNDQDWGMHSSNLLSLARRFVYRYRVPSWYGQEEVIAEDVAQETIRRMLDRLAKAEQGVAEPVTSIEHMMLMIARNYVVDLRRSNRRVVHLSGCLSSGKEIELYEPEDISEIAVDHVYQGWLFLRIAGEIDCFPNKQRRAILIDLANRMSFNEQPTQLQRAFLVHGIHLQDYLLPLPDDPGERARHRTLVTIAYKRLGLLVGHII